MTDAVRAKLEELFGYGGEVGLRLSLVCPAIRMRTQRLQDTVQWVMSAEDEIDLEIRKELMSRYHSHSFDDMLLAYQFVKTGEFPALAEHK
ncbi:MAG: hypothetical protein Q4A61_03495 [Porphyromonadaceae bacterium]|nr:hypothetical protein [Porphyromonadaceae bacterium]